VQRQVELPHVLNTQPACSSFWSICCRALVSGVMVERVKGIEPSYAAWEAAVLPLNYTRIGEPLSGIPTCI
jgi:hypothetical protein